jgi:hypothetical protein
LILGYLIRDSINELTRNSWFFCALESKEYKNISKTIIYDITYMKIRRVLSMKAKQWIYNFNSLEPNQKLEIAEELVEELKGYGSVTTIAPIASVTTILNVFVA